METVVSFRQQELVDRYCAALDAHLAALRAGSVERMHEIRDFAALLHVHPVHLSNTIREVTGRSACALYEERILALAKALLQDRARPIGDVARQLTYDPSNFTKFFKAYTGMTPKEFRRDVNRRS